MSRSCGRDGAESDPDTIHDLEANVQEILKEKAITKLIMIAILIGLSSSISLAAGLAGPHLGSLLRGRPIGKPPWPGTC